jgi:hypothetical protein
MSRFGKYLSAIVIFGAVPLVAAQTPADPAPAPTAPAGPVAPTSKLTAAEMTATIPTYEEQIKADGQHMVHLKEVATKQKDVIKLTCLNDKLIQLKAQQNIWDSNKATFQVAVTKSDTDRITAYNDLTGVAHAVHTLRDEANACVGEPELYKQEAGVEVTHPPFPDDPTAVDPFDPGMNDLEPPAYASPWF